MKLNRWRLSNNTHSTFTDNDDGEEDNDDNSHDNDNPLIFIIIILF